MFSRFFTKVVTAAVLLSQFSGVLAAPAGWDSLDHEARDILARSTPSAPHFVVYGDKFVSGETGPPSPSEISGFNVFALSFLLVEGAFDKAQEWASLSDSQRTSVKQQYANAGIKLVVSAFGSTDIPTTTGVNPVSIANTMANWVKQFQIDGIDVDYEDLGAMNAQNGGAENWLITFTQTLRNALPQGQYIITHAPLAPWFTPNRWASGAYLKVDQTVGSLIDWYNVQFYNQGSNEYTTCSGLIDQSSSAWPNTAVFQIAASGVPLNKIVIGKPANTADATNGFIDTNTLHSCVAEAASKGWSGGIMSWEFPDAAASWIQTVRGNTFPLSGGGSTAPPPPSAPSAPSGGSGKRIHPNGDTSKCLDVQADVVANGTPVQIYDCNGSAAQNWLINSGTTAIQLAGTNYCIDAGTTPANNVAMKIWQCFPGLAQQTWFYTGDQRIAVQNQGQCLDDTNASHADGTILQTYTCTTGNTNQVWTLS